MAQRCNFCKKRIPFGESQLWAIWTVCQSCFDKQIKRKIQLSKSKMKGGIER